MRTPADIRKAELADAPALELLIADSIRALSPAYSAEQIEGALGTVFGVDRQLIADGTYFVAEIDGELVGCGGWSKRKTLFGGDAGRQRDAALLDPMRDPARIRAFFTAPNRARQGIGSAILRRCEASAAAAGFSQLELIATLAGEALYRARGFEALERFEIPLSNGRTLPVVRMVKFLGAREDSL